MLSMFDARNMLDDGLPPELGPPEAELRATASNAHMRSLMSYVTRFDDGIATVRSCKVGIMSAGHSCSEDCEDWSNGCLLPGFPRSSPDSDEVQLAVSL